MSDEELMELIKSVDPLAVRLPPGIRAIAKRIEQASRRSALEQAAKVCDESAADWKETAQGHYNGTYDNMADAAERCAEAIRSLSKKESGE